MPGHVISDAHEWINEIPTVPTYWWRPLGRQAGGSPNSITMSLPTGGPEITPRQVVCRDRECIPRPDLPVVPPGLRSVVADFMGKSGGSEGGLSVPLIGGCPRKVDRGGWP
jgi:hypothetical protein